MLVTWLPERSTRLLDDVARGGVRSDGLKFMLKSVVCPSMIGPKRSRRPSSNRNRVSLQTGAIRTAARGLCFQLQGGRHSGQKLLHVLLLGLLGLNAGVNIDE